MGLPTSENCIALAERSGGFTLPAKWKQMLLRSNGFAVEANQDDWDAFPVWDDSSRKHIARSANHILRETGSLRDFPRFPPDAIAIASMAAEIAWFSLRRRAISMFGTMRRANSIWLT